MSEALSTKKQFKYHLQICKWYWFVIRSLFIFEYPFKPLLIKSSKPPLSFKTYKPTNAYIAVHPGSTYTCRYIFAKTFLERDFGIAHNFNSYAKVATINGSFPYSETPSDTTAYCFVANCTADYQFDQTGAFGQIRKEPKNVSCKFDKTSSVKKSIPVCSSLP